VPQPDAAPSVDDLAGDPGIADLTRKIAANASDAVSRYKRGQRYAFKRAYALAMIAKPAYHLGAEALARSHTSLPTAEMLAGLHGGGHHALRILAAAASNSWIESTNSRTRHGAMQISDPAVVRSLRVCRFPSWCLEL
jgi:hypothetical protein